ncbi:MULTISPECIES: APC family permease [unclassified Streptomyces]|uniref:APC family permease n=1 Tax=unclassified Streptomyces TaxID=2593676 RepID=UPI002E79DE73|nr:MULTISPECIES: APC family permease [unclassified Streptomyces]MEE1757634.1 APC family permease [Streptomyces sp. SP18BB07]MEE1830414.1 APC family permease [Streptomyces sp. SP17KL33]
MSTTDTVVSADAGPRLGGNLGALHLFFSVMAFNAPLVVVIGVLPIMLAIGNGVGTPIAFLAAGLIVAAFAVPFTRMARVFPNPGAFYVYITAGLGRTVGLGSGFMALVGYLSVNIGSYGFGGVVFQSMVRDTFHGPDVDWWLWGALLWAATTVLGYLKIDLSAKVLTVFLFLELAVIVVYDAAVMFQGGASGLSAAPFSPSHWFDGSFAVGLLYGLGMYGGFEVAALFRDEVRHPTRTVPRATFGLIAVAMVLYAGTAWLYISSLGVDKAVSIAGANPAGSILGSIETFGGKVLFDLATVMVTTSTFAVILAAHNISARYVFNLSADGILPRRLSGVHAKHGSPHAASLATSGIGLVVLAVTVLSGADVTAFFTVSLGLASFTGVAAISLANLAIALYLRKHHKNEFSVWSTVVMPVLAGIGLAVELVLTIKNFPHLVNTSTGVATLLLAALTGVFVVGVVMALVYRRTRPEVYSKIGRQ